VNGVADPVDAGITTDGLVLGVDKDDLVVLVGGVLVDPVGVQDAQVSSATANTLLSGGLESTLVLELVDTVVGGLACSHNHTLAKKFLRFPQIFKKSAFDRRISYRKWHPWGQGACGHRGGHGHGR
jgi:hypothetical protein